jgi:hypothetical protein
MTNPTTDMATAKGYAARVQDMIYQAMDECQAEHPMVTVSTTDIVERIIDNSAPEEFGGLILGALVIAANAVILMDPESRRALRPVPRQHSKPAPAADDDGTLYGAYL